MILSHNIGRFASIPEKKKPVPYFIVPRRDRATSVAIFGS